MLTDAVPQTISDFEFRISNLPATGRTTEAQRGHRGKHRARHRKHEVNKSRKPPTIATEETADHADRRRWSRGRLEHVARSRPSSDNGRGPEDRATAPNASIRRRFPILRPALEASAGLATSLFYLKVGRGKSPSNLRKKGGGTDAPRARRPVGSTATTDACVRRCRASHRLAAIVRSPTVPPPIAALQHQEDYLRLSA